MVLTAAHLCRLETSHKRILEKDLELSQVNGQLELLQVRLLLPLQPGHGGGGVQNCHLLDVCVEGSSPIRTS